MSAQDDTCQPAHDAGSIRASVDDFAAFLAGDDFTRFPDEEINLLVDEVRVLAQRSLDLNPEWLTLADNAVSTTVSHLHAVFLDAYPHIQGTYREHVPHWMLRDAWQNEALRPEVSAMLAPCGATGAFLLLAVENLYFATEHLKRIEQARKLPDRIESLRSMYVYYGRAAICWAMMNMVMPVEGELLVSIAARHAQAAGNAPFDELKKLAIEEWEAGLVRGKFRESGKGNGPKQAAIAIASKLAPVARKLMKGKHGKHGIAVGNGDTVYKWILAHLAEQRSV